MEVGRYMDWHYGDTGSEDYSVRLENMSNNGLKLTNSNGYLEFGPMNGSHAHLQTDRATFYFNKGILVDTGVVGSYNEDLYLRRAGSSSTQIQIASTYVNVTNTIHAKDGLRLSQGGWTEDPEGVRYDWGLTGMGTDTTTWKKVATVTLNSGLYTALNMTIELVSQTGNFGSTSEIDTSHITALFYRSSNVENNVNNASLVGNNTDDHELRIVKTATGTYELQLRMKVAYRDAILRCQVQSTNGGDIVFTDNVTTSGSTSGTIYTMTLPGDSTSHPKHIFPIVKASEVQTTEGLTVDGTQVINGSGVWVGSSSGLKGEPGAKGNTGAKGQKGEIGVGQKGATGAKGQKGEVGAKGATGQKGEVGAKGATGQKGQKGESVTGQKGEVGQKGNEAGNAGTLDGYDSSRFMRRQSKANATVGPGWMTVASNGSGRSHGEIVVTDGDSSDHSFIRIDWMRSYADSNFSVINCGGHSNRITGARVIYQTSDNTYGLKYLQVYVGASSNYEVNVYEHGDIDDYGSHSVVTPVIENSKSGYALHGSDLTALQNVSLAAEEAISANGYYVDNTQVINGSGAWVGSSSGLKGEPGAKGQKGEVGQKGATGQKGQKGEVGQKGATGQKGEVGQKGATGSKGQKGEIGLTDAPYGAVPAYSNSDVNTITWNAAEEAMELQSSDTQIGTAFPAFRVNLTGNETHKLSVKVKSNTTSSSGLYVRVYEYNASLPSGKVAVSNSASYSLVQEDTSGKTNWIENQSINTSWSTKEYTYTPTSGAAWASIVILNWSGMGTSSLYIRDPMWQLIGSSGAKGQKGEIGQKGATGAKGQKGEVGAPGAKGQKGEIGVGQKGATGQKGEVGVGQKGEVGQKGAQGSAASDASRMDREDNRTISPSELSAGHLKFGFTSWANNSTGPYADFLHMRSYTDSSGGSDNLFMLKKGGLGARVWQQSYGSSTAYSNYVDLLDSGGTAQIKNGSLTIGNASINANLTIKKADDNISDHLQFYMGSTRMGEIGTQDTSWLRINQVTSKNIYTPRLFRADGGLQTTTGTATAPAICYHNDPNTGIFFPGSDVFKITTGGVNAVTVNTTDIQLIRDTVSVKDYLRHYGDTDTYFRFTTDRIRMVAGNVTFMDATEGATDYLRFPTRAVTIGSNTAPQATFTIDQGCTETPANGCGTGNDAHMKLENTNTTGSASTCIIFNAKDSGGNMRHGAGIQFKKAIAWSANGQYPGELYFWTRPTSGNQAAAQKLDKDGNAIFKGNVTAYGSLSDRRLKENIENIPDATKKVQELNGVTFNYKKDGKKATGLIAQELQEVLPEAVYTSENIETGEEHLAIHYGNVIGLLVESIKELKAEIEDLKNDKH